jgi:hypothetical protein
MLTFGIARSEATQMVMEEKLTRLTHKTSVREVVKIRELPLMYRE